MGPSVGTMASLLRHLDDRRMTINDSSPAPGTVAVIGGHGKTGRRVAAKLAARGRDVRVLGRGTSPAFDWDAPATCRR